MAEVLRSVVTRKARYRFLVEASQISPPLMGRWHFAGVLRGVIQFTNGGPGARIDFPPMVDTYGETKSEAETKVAVKTRAWLAERDGGRVDQFVP
jgi:hypothetical protein